MLNKFIGLILILKLLIAVSALKLDDPPEPEICNTPDCVVAAHSLIQNMDLTADPCEDFYQYACGNFEKRVSLYTYLFLQNKIFVTFPLKKMNCRSCRTIRFAN